MNDHDYLDYFDYRNSIFDQRVWEPRPHVSVAKVTITVNVPLSDTTSTNSVILKAMQYMAKSVVDNDNDTFKAMNAAGWQVHVESGLF